MSYDDEYEDAISSISQKIVSLQTKVNNIEFKTIFKQTANNDLIMISDLMDFLHNSGFGNTNNAVFRFTIISRSLFVDILSACEYEIRNFIIKHQDTKLDNTKRQLKKNPMKSISKLIDNLKEAGYLDNDNHEKLAGLFAIRNMIVHHHSRVNDQKDKVPCEIQEMFADFTMGKRLYGKPDMFLNLIGILIDVYSQWYKDKGILELIFKQEQLANH